MVLKEGKEKKGQCLFAEQFFELYCNFVILKVIKVRKN